MVYPLSKQLLPRAGFSGNEDRQPAGSGFLSIFDE